MMRTRFGALAGTWMFVWACEGKGPPSEAARSAPATASTHASPRIIAAPKDAPIEATMVAAIADATARHRALLIYIGASWCEPCTRFHDALLAGELDDVLGGVDFVEFDADVVGPQLEAAGCGGRLLPRFVIPTPDGRCSDENIEGGIKGEGAVAQLVPRIRALLETAQRP